MGDKKQHTASVGMCRKFLKPRDFLSPKTSSKEVIKSTWYTAVECVRNTAAQAVWTVTSVAVSFCCSVLSMGGGGRGIRHPRGVIYKVRYSLNWQHRSTVTEDLVSTCKNRDGCKGMRAI